MGLASKLAAANAAAPGAPPGAPPGQFPGQPQYQPYPGGASAPAPPPPNPGSMNPPPPGQYGGPPGPGPQYGGAPSPGQMGMSQAGGPPNQGLVNAFKRILYDAIRERGLEHFYPPNSPAIDSIANRAPQQVDQMSARWRLPREVANDIVKMGLYDIVLYIDDSGSMQFEENGERIKDLQLILQRVAYAATLFDEDGISVRFMNSVAPPHIVDGIRNDQQIDSLMRSISFKGLTPMGTELKKKVLDELVIPKARSHQLRKPVLIIAITDGQPAGEPSNAVIETLKSAHSELSRTPYGPGAVAYQFAQVGNDQKAREFLERLDNDPVVGRWVDCTSNYENESAEMARSIPPVDLTPELWLVKLLLGAIDSSYDTKDEKNFRPPPVGPGGHGYPPGPGSYGMPPPSQPGGGYPQPQPGYGHGPLPPPGGGGYNGPPVPPRY